MQLLDFRCSDLEGFAHEQLRTLWKAMIRIDRDNRVIEINRQLDGKSPLM
jgi:hypothetical protein